MGRLFINLKKSLKPLVLAMAGVTLVACSSAPKQISPVKPVPSVSKTLPPVKKTSPVVNVPKTSNTPQMVAIPNNSHLQDVLEESGALLDEESLEELEGLLEATDMTMVEGDALDVQKYGDLWDRLRKNYKLDLNYHDSRIEAQKGWFVSRQDYLNRLTARASRYFYHTIREAERRNIPAELALLPVIESSYDPVATSNAAAAGLWQFIPSTGRIYGLNQTATFDGRRDVIESTRAAYDFLTTLYNQFGSWELALAAYNAGPGRVQSAIDYNAARGLPTDYWSLRLPKETMNYVPRFLAVAQIVKNPSAYNVYLPPIANRQHFRSVETNVGASLSDVSQLTGVSFNELKALNASLIAGRVDIAGPNRVIIPNDVDFNIDAKISALTSQGISSTYTVQQSAPAFQKQPLPKSGAELAAQANTLLKQNSHYVAPTHSRLEPPLSVAEQRQLTSQMQRDNTLPTTSAYVTNHNTITQEPPLSKAELNAIAQEIEQNSPQVNKAINPVDGNIQVKAIQTQQSILGATGQTKKLSYGNSEKKSRPAGTRTTYVVKYGDTLSSIANRAGVSVNDIANWNQLNINGNLLAGTTLYLYNAKPIESPKPKVTKKLENYRVQSGDTLTAIANKFDLSVAELASYNNLPNNYQVKTGQTLWLIPDKVPNSRITSSNRNKSQGTTSTYTVQSGDTLIGIANKLGVSASDIADVNTFNENHRLVRGKNIVVPVSQTKIEHALGDKTVVYTVKSGDTLTSVADHFNLTQTEIAVANNLKITSKLKKGQKLTIPKGDSKAYSKQSPNTNTKTEKTTSYKGQTENYTVKSGDSLNALSAKYGISAAQLADLNNLKANAGLLRGQTIKVPKTTTTYKVRSGDTLISLAKRYGVTTKALADLNKLSPQDTLKIGQTLTVPIK